MVIAETMEKIMAIAEKYPEVKADKTFIKTMDAVNQYESMILTSRLSFNNSIFKMKRAICIFPVSMVAGRLGFKADVHRGSGRKTAMLVNTY